MSVLEISLLGTFQVALGRRSQVAFKTDKCRALLAYLGVESDRPHRRDSLAALFWPDWPEAAARHNLRQTLYRVRIALGDAKLTSPFILCSFQDLQFNPEADWWLDVVEFRRLLAICHGGHSQPGVLCPTCREALISAVGLYRGEFMPGFNGDEEPLFQQWQNTTRERCHRQVIRALDRLALDRELAKDYKEAAAWARKKIDLEPWLESAHRQAMRALALSGERHAAIVQYDRCRQLLKDEFNQPPSVDTQELYAHILDGYREPIYAGIAANRQ